MFTKELGEASVGRPVLSTTTTECPKSARRRAVASGPSSCSSILEPPYGAADGAQAAGERPPGLSPAHLRAEFAR